MARSTKGAGKLIQLVAFDERQLVPNGYGAKQAGFVEQFQIRAEFEFLKGGEAVIAARLEAKQPVLIRVRACADTRRIKPDWQIRDLHNGVAYAIRAVAPTPDRAAFSILAEGGVAA
jgi:hypothetical protein